MTVFCIRFVNEHGLIVNHQLHPAHPTRFTVENGVIKPLNGEMVRMSRVTRSRG